MIPVRSLRTSLGLLALLGCGHAPIAASAPATQAETEPAFRALATPESEAIMLPPALCTYRAEPASWFNVGFDADSFVRNGDGYEGFTDLCVPETELGTVNVILPRNAIEVGLWIRGQSPTLSFVGALPRAELGYRLRLSRPVLFGGVIAVEAYEYANIVGVADDGPVIRAPRLEAFTPSVSMDEQVGCDALTAKSQAEGDVPRQNFASPMRRRGVEFLHDGPIPVSVVAGGPVVGTLIISESSDREAELLEEGARQVRIAFHDQDGATVFAWVPRSVVRLLQRDPQVSGVRPLGGGGCSSEWTQRRETVTCEHSLPLLARFGAVTRRVGEIHARTPIYVLGETSDHLLQFSVGDSSSLQHANTLLTTRCD